MVEQGQRAKAARGVLFMEREGERRRLVTRLAGRQAIVSHSRATSNNLQQKPRRTESKEERERERERDKWKVSEKTKNQ